MAKTDVLDILRAKKMDPLEFHFENLWIPPMNYYLTDQDVEALRKIATSVRLSSKIQQKYKMIDSIMRPRGFKRFSAGTNRIVYRCLEDERFLVKIAVDKVGMQDNPLEFKNQFHLQPFVTKMFYVSDCGTVGFAERVLPIKNKEEFRQVASDVFDIILNKIIGEYVVEDIGTKYFMNWGLRIGFGPVLLDYPYVYKLDGDKLFCSAVNPDTKEVCDGEIDYDSGFNHLVCTKCGKIYLATNLRDDSEDNKIVIKQGGFQMRVVLKRGSEVICEPMPMDDTIQPAERPYNVSKSNLVVELHRPGHDTEVYDNKEEKAESRTFTVSLNRPIEKVAGVKEPEIAPARTNMENDIDDEKEIEITDENEVVNTSEDSSVDTILSDTSINCDSEYPLHNYNDEDNDITCSSYRSEVENDTVHVESSFISTASAGYGVKSKDKKKNKPAAFIPSTTMYYEEENN